MNYDNLFQFCNPLLTTENSSWFYFGNKFANGVFLFAWDNVTKEIYSKSNEWLYLLKDAYYHMPNKRGIYDFMVNEMNTIRDTKKGLQNIDYATCDVVSFATCFSKGTVHGYAGLFSILIEYTCNPDAYKDKHIVIYRNSQKGILDIIHHLVNKNIIPREKLIYVNDNTSYLFNSITFIPTECHILVSGHFEHEVYAFLHKYYFIDTLDKKYIQSLQLPTNDRIAIIKSSTSTNNTTEGQVPEHLIQSFCQKNQLQFVEPSNRDEMFLIQTVHQSRIVVLSWGTAYMKNFIYISDDCQHIYVLVIGSFINQYVGPEKNHISQFRNAKITYHVVKDDLSDFIVPLSL